MPGGRIAILSFLFLLLCPKPAHTWRPAPKRIPPITIWQVKNAEYQLAFDGRKYKLINGKYVSGKIGQGNYISIIVDIASLGDMDGDANADAAVLLAVTGGGTGTFHELAIILNKGGKPVYAGTKRGLGDRNIVESLAIAGGTAVIGLKVPGPGDALCCPTKKVKWKFRLKWDKRLKYHVVQVR